jgi:hypothetical protein
VRLCKTFLPRLIELGLDVYDVVQPTTPEMDIAVLKKDFGNKIAFCGSVCVQSTLAYGNVADVVEEVERRKKLFRKGGLFWGPLMQSRLERQLIILLLYINRLGAWLIKLTSQFYQLWRTGAHPTLICQSCFSKR